MNVPIKLCFLLVLLTSCNEERDNDLASGEGSKSNPNSENSSKFTNNVEFLVDGKRITYLNFRREDIEHFIEEGYSKKEIVSELGDPSIDAGDFVIYKFWNPAELRNRGRKGIVGFIIYFDDYVASRIAVKSIG